ncbi:MAG: Beta-galactosidase C-terminal domain, partial [Microbacterium sp.]|nr:Beta-galactosidase C-terminal domain [Microbacterium sp.]
PSPEAYRALVARLADAAGIAAAPGAGPDVDVVRRVGADAAYRFVINHGADPVEVAVTGTELLTGSAATGIITVPAGAVRIIKEDV